jgi:hypothetical protein
MSAGVYENGVRLSDATVISRSPYGEDRYYDAAIYDGGGYRAAGNFDSETGKNLSGNGLILMAEWPGPPEGTGTVDLTAEDLRAAVKRCTPGAPDSYADRLLGALSTAGATARGLREGLRAAVAQCTPGAPPGYADRLLEALEQVYESGQP